MRNLIFFLLFGVISSASAEAVVYQIKASYIYNFLQFVQFSEQPAQGPLHVCIFGKNKFGSALDDVDGAATPEGKIKIHFIKSYQDPASLSQCKVLYFVGDDNAAFNQKVLADINTTEVLTIGESSDFIGMGGYIELFILDDSIRFRFNKKLVGNTQFKVAAQLLSLGV
jgi:hypothetical protein